MILPQLFLLLLLLVSSLTVDCPEGYLPHDDSCYAFIMHTATWAQAREYCRSLKSHLNRIETSKEQSYIIGHTSRLGGDFWIAGYDFLEEGTWYWDGRIPIRTSWWYAGQPSGGITNNCIGLIAKFNHSWFAKPCETYFHFICEIRAASKR